MKKTGQKNVLGGELELCCNYPKTGFYRDGFCRTDFEDQGAHVVCCKVTEDFLEFSKEKGNDLTTPNLQFGFPGLRPGDKWCVCAARWQEALEADRACPIILASTHERVLDYVSLGDLMRYGLDVH